MLEFKVMSSTYPSPASSVEVEIEVRKSRFIARAARATERQAALALVAQSRQDFPDARHHCWAYLLGNPASASSAATNDAGEPSGTAGRPILNVIQHKGIGDVLVVIARYFGGIKLGAGGLVRAYTSAAEAALSGLSLTQVVAQRQVKLTLEFGKEQLLRHWLESHAAQLVNITYGEQVEVEINLPESAIDTLDAFCAAHGIRHQL